MNRGARFKLHSYYSPLPPVQLPNLMNYTVPPEEKLKQGGHQGDAGSTNSDGPWVQISRRSIYLTCFECHSCTSDTSLSFLLKPYVYVGSAYAFCLFLMCLLTPLEYMLGYLQFQCCTDPVCARYA